LPSNRPLIVVEDDRWLRVVGVVLDPETSTERVAAFADFMAHDAPDFGNWCARLRARAGRLFPAQVRLVATAAELPAEIGAAEILIVEQFPVDARLLARAPRLAIVQKYGAIARNIDAAACAARGVEVRTHRRRANIACAEHAFALMLALAKKVSSLNGVVSIARLEAAGLGYRPFDRRHTANGNFGRVSGVQMLHEATLGIIGLGEVGREIALRAHAFGMRVLYFQRMRLRPDEEAQLNARYAPFDDLLAASDFVVPQVPLAPETRNLIGAAELARMKPSAFLVNVSAAPLVDRAALVTALRAKRLGGFALDALYEEPAREDDELLQFPNVILVPHLAASPRQNGLRDFEDIITGLAGIASSGDSG
jgi:phosphoglycerate dehydrogenase-like enzyme